MTLPATEYLAAGQAIRTDWTRPEIAALFDLPFTELVFRAATVHRAHHATQALCFMAGANSIFIGDKLLTAPNAGDDADGAMFARLGLTAMAGEEPMRACAVREPAE